MAERSQARRARSRITYLAAMFPLVVAVVVTLWPSDEELTWGVVIGGAAILIAALLWERRRYRGVA